MSIKFLRVISHIFLCYRKHEKKTFQHCKSSNYSHNLYMTGVFVVQLNKRWIKTVWFYLNYFAFSYKNQGWRVKNSLTYLTIFVTSKTYVIHLEKMSF